MPTASITYADHPHWPAPRSLPVDHDRRRAALRALLAALAAAPLHPAFAWLAPCAPWLSAGLARKP